MTAIRCEGPWVAPQAAADSRCEGSPAPHRARRPGQSRGPRAGRPRESRRCYCSDRAEGRGEHGRDCPEGSSSALVARITPLPHSTVAHRPRCERAGARSARAIAMPAVTDTAPWRLGPEPSAPADPAPAPQATTPVAAAPVNSTAVTPPQPPVAVVAPPVVAGPPQLPATAVPSPPAPAVAAAPPPQQVAAPAAPQRKAGPATLIGVTPPPYAVAAAVPAQPAVAEPALARAPATPQRPEPHEDPRILARAVIEEALVPVHNAFRDLQRRIEEIERRPLATAATVGAAHSPAAATAAATAAALQTPYRAPQETYPGAGGSMAPIPVTLGSLAPRPPNPRRRRHRARHERRHRRRPRRAAPQDPARDHLRAASPGGLRGAVRGAGLQLPATHDDPRDAALRREFARPRLTRPRRHAVTTRSFRGSTTRLALPTGRAGGGGGGCHTA